MLCLITQDEWGSTALRRACIGGHVETATLLINKEAAVNYLNKVINHYNYGRFISSACKLNQMHVH